MGAGGSVEEHDEAGAVAAKLQSISPAYEMYAQRVVDAGLTGAVIKSLSEAEVAEVLNELGVTVLHRKVLVHALNGGANTDAVIDAASSSSIGIKPAYCFTDVVTPGNDYFRVGYGEACMPDAFAALARFVDEHKQAWRAAAPKSRL